MPIQLGAPTTNPKWSKFWLLTFWITQLLIILFLEFWTGILVLVVGASGGHKVMPWYFTLILITMLISQFLIFCTICYELSYASCLTYLSASRFLKMQLAKSNYFVFFVLVFTISGSSFPMDPEATAGGAAYAWAVCWRLMIFVGPFWSALGYAFWMKRAPKQEFVEFEYTDHPTNGEQA